MQELDFSTITKIISTSKPASNHKINEHKYLQETTKADEDFLRQEKETKVRVDKIH